MKKIGIRRLLSLVFALVFVVSAGMFAYKLYDYRQGEKDYQEAEELVDLPDLTQIAPTQPAKKPAADPGADVSAPPAEEKSAEEPVEVWVDPYADALANMDFAALREVNDDILGWIVIPNTRVSYPLVQGEDNEYYLNRTWRKYRNSVGAIYMEWQCSPDLSDFNTIIYGHRVNNRSMFGTLLKYKEADYCSANPRFYITDDSGSHTYEIFAAYEVALGKPTYWLDIQETEHKQMFIDFCLEQSVIDTGVIPTVADKIVTLSTCTGEGHDTRWVVQGVEWAPAEEPVSEVTGEAAPSETASDIAPESEATVPEAPAGETEANPAQPEVGKLADPSKPA